MRLTANDSDSLFPPFHSTVPSVRNSSVNASTVTLAGSTAASLLALLGKMTAAIYLSWWLFEVCCGMFGDDDSGLIWFEGSG